MLKNWQNKYPNSFLPFPNIDNELSTNEQVYLSELFQFIEKTSSGLLNEEVLNHILHNSIYTNYYLYNLKESLELFTQFSPLSPEVLTVLVSTKNHRDCVEFISKALKNEIDITDALHFLSHHAHLDGLSRAMYIFERSDLSFRQEHLEKLSILSRVLTNPLCRTIFDMRLRGFSDYTIVSCPLVSLNTDEIIHQVIDSKDEDRQIQVFFDYFAQFRPFPPSQKYMIFVDVTDRVANELESTDLSVYPNDLERIFNQIKYQVASNIERDDLYSTRSYQDHMTQIWLALNQLHPVPSYQGFFTDTQSEQTFQSETNFCGK